MRLSIRPVRPVIVVAALAGIALAAAVFFPGPSGTRAEQGQYLHFTGPDGGYIEVPDAPALNPSMEITIEAWVFITSGAGWGADALSDGGCPTFVGKNYNTAYWFGLDCGGSTQLSFYANAGDNAQSTGSVPIGEWAHVAVTYDGADVKFYINGVLDSTVPLAGVISSSSDPLQIGHDVAWDSSPIGHIDEVHLWSVARSQAAIAADMEPITTSQIGLVGVWNMEGSPNADVGGFTGTLTGDAEFAGTPITPPPTAEPPFLKGDVTCDHLVNTADLSPLLRFGVGLGAYPAPCELALLPFSVQGFAQWFDASQGQGYVEVPDDSALNPADAITIEARVNLWSYLSPTGGSGCSSLVGKGYLTAYWFGLCSGHLRFYPRGQGSLHDSTGVVPLRQWVHIAAVADHTSVKFYINGQLDSEFTTDDAPLSQNTQPLRIASDIDYNFPPWAGLSEVRIWDIARSQADIQATMGDAISTPQAGLVAVYPLAGNADDALGGHNGAAVGAVSFGSTLPLPYFHDIDCDGLVDATDLLPLVAYIAGVADAVPVPDGCEAVGAPTS